MKLVTLKNNVDEGARIFSLYDPPKTCKAKIKHQIERNFGSHSCEFLINGKESYEVKASYDLEFDNLNVNVAATMIVNPDSVFVKQINTNCDGKTFEFFPVKKNLNVPRTREFCDRVVSNSYRQSMEAEE